MAGSRFEVLSVLMDLRPDVVLPPRLPAPEISSTTVDRLSVTWSTPWASEVGGGEGALASAGWSSSPKAPLTGFRLQYVTAMGWSESVPYSPYPAPCPLSYLVCLLRVLVRVPVGCACWVCAGLARVPRGPP